MNWIEEFDEEKEIQIALALAEHVDKLFKEEENNNEY